MREQAAMGPKVTLGVGRLLSTEGCARRKPRAAGLNWGRGAITSSTQNTWQELPDVMGLQFPSSSPPCQIEDQPEEPGFWGAYIGDWRDEGLLGASSGVA